MSGVDCGGRQEETRGRGDEEVEKIKLEEEQAELSFVYCENVQLNCFCFAAVQVQLIVNMIMSMITTAIQQCNYDYYDHQSCSIPSLLMRSLPFLAYLIALVYQSVHASKLGTHVLRLGIWPITNIIVPFNGRFGRTGRK